MFIWVTAVQSLRFNRRIAPHFLIAFRFLGAETDKVTTMSILVKEFTLHRDDYFAPEAEVIVIKNDRSFLVSGDDDDNEHTGEEDLF